MSEELALPSLLHSFTNWEKKSALLFLQSPYHNSNPRLTALFQALCQAPDADPESLHRKAFGPLPYQNLRLRQLSSELLHLLEDWLVTEALHRQPLRSQDVLLHAYQQRGLASLFQRRLKALEKQMAQPIPHSPDWHLAQFRLQEAALAFGTMRDHPSPERLPLLDDALDRFWCLHKIKYACSWLSYRQLLTMQQEPALLREALALAVSRGWTHDPSFGVWFHAWHCLANEEEGHFDPLHTALLEQGSDLPQGDLPALTLIAINYCIARINKGDAAQLPVLFALYRAGIDNKALLPDGKLSPWTFKNVLSASLRLREFEWATQFASQYGPLLTGEYREGLMAYGRARIHFEQGEFAAVRRLLLGIHIKELFTLLDARVLEMQACWEVGDTASIGALLDNFTRLLRRRKMLTYHKDNYLHFARLLRLMLSLPPGSPGQRAALRTEVEGTEPLTYRKWFLQKLDQH